MSDYGDPPPAPPRRRRRRGHLDPFLEDIQAVESLTQSLARLSQQLAAREERFDDIVEPRYQASIAPTPLGDNLPAPSWPRSGISLERLQVMQAQGLLPPEASAWLEQVKAKCRPAVTITSALPETTYKDQEDSKGTEKTLKYLEVQRTVLKYLEKKAADTLTWTQARQWTQAIDGTGNKEPKAEEALRLCYYMRSQGYDVYSKIDKEAFALFVVNQRSNERGAPHDRIYWIQNFETNEDMFDTPEEETPIHRRNAVVGHPPYVYRGDATNEVDAQVARRSAAPQPARVRARSGPESRLAAAEARLQRLIEREDADPDVVAAAIDEHAALQAQLHPEAEPAQ